MERLTENKIILIKRKTRLEELVARYNTLDQARFYIEHLGGDFSDYVNEDSQYKKALRQSEETLSALGRLQIVDRDYVPNFIFGDHDIVVAIGQDGLVANTVKYLNGQPLVGVNPDPRRWDGVLLPFEVQDLAALLPEVFAGKRSCKQVSMAKASLSDGQILYGVNDLFIGQRTHVSSRYHIRCGEAEEDQSSSGIIISTGLGSSGWLKSIVAGARGVMASLEGEAVSSETFRAPAWDENCLQFTVREPFPSRSSMASIIFGRITEENPMYIVSAMPENGVIFSDGMESDFLEFNAGMEATITIAEKKGYLVG